VAPEFFGYDKDIQEELGRAGYAVDRLLDRPLKGAEFAVAARLAPGLISSAASRYYVSQLDRLLGSYDLVLVVNGQTLAPAVLKQFRRAFPRATFILYLWDSLDNRPGLKRVLDLYDYVFSFDATDARSLGLYHRPSFYTTRFDRNDIDPDIDISFIGTAHADRARIVQAIDSRLAVGISRYWYLYLQAKWVYWIYKARGSLSGYGLEDFRYRALTRAQSAEIFHRSRAILDIHHPRQRGLTMRVFEALAAGKKIVTTNTQIRSYEIYDERGVFIVDRMNPQPIPTDFFCAPGPVLTGDLLRRYSLQGWLGEILRVAHLRPARHSE